MKKNMLKLTIASPESALFSGEIERVVLPGNLGEFEVRKNHAPLMSLLDMGTVIAFPKSEKPLGFCIDSGLAQINNNQVFILVDTAYKARLQEKEKILSQQDAYRKQLKSPGLVDHAALLKQLAQLTSELNAINRIQKYRNKT